jgi:hypothetical protein
MDPRSISDYVSSKFEGVNTVEANGDYFFIYDPNRDLPPNRQIPFATVVTSDAYDSVSNLNRPGAYRVNVGVSKETFESLFGASPQAEWDYTAFDVPMPHPEYGHMHYVSILNPSEANEESVRAWLDEAYARMVERIDRFRRRGAAADDTEEEA